MGLIFLCGAFSVTMAKRVCVQWLSALHFCTWILTLCMAASTDLQADGLRARLAEIEGVAKEVFEKGALDGNAVSMLEQELQVVEKGIQTLRGSESHELYFMASILRGTIYQQSTGLTDDQVELMKNAFTFSNPRFWDRYYEQTETDSNRFDLYGTWHTEIRSTTLPGVTTLGALIRPYLQAESDVLMLGCGRSDLSEKMYRAGFEKIVNVDISEHLLDILRGQLASNHPQMSWVKMNASALDINSSSVDVIIDKGTLDSLQENSGLLQAAIREGHRVLRLGGFFLSITDVFAELRLADQLQRFAYWGQCRTHTGYLQTANGAKLLHVHVCRRTSDDVWTRVSLFFQPSPWPSAEL